MRSNNWSTNDEEVLAEKNTCLQGQSLCAFVVRRPPLSLCNSPSDEMCLKR